jgi:serine protease inhibitor
MKGTSMVAASPASANSAGGSITALWSQKGSKLLQPFVSLLKKHYGAGKKEADHPFLFLIRDTASGTILFMGRMSDPAA